jgi:GT2 family glycosyltransferase
VLPTAAETPGGFVLALVVGNFPAVYVGRIGTDVLAGGHMAAYRSAFAEVGGFDERLGAGATFAAADDNDLGFRLLEAGYRIIYVPEVVLYHRAWRSRRDYLPMHWNYGRGKGGFYTKYLSLRDRYMLRRMVWDIAHRVLLFPRHVCYERHRACADAVYVLGILSGAVQWILTQRSRTATW